MDRWDSETSLRTAADPGESTRAMLSGGFRLPAHQSRRRCGPGRRCVERDQPWSTVFDAQIRRRVGVVVADSQARRRTCPTRCRRRHWPARRRRVRVGPWSACRRCGASRWRVGRPRSERRRRCRRTRRARWRRRGPSSPMRGGTRDRDCRHTRCTAAHGTDRPPRRQRAGTSRAQPLRAPTRRAQRRTGAATNA